MSRNSKVARAPMRGDAQPAPSVFAFVALGVAMGILLAAVVVVVLPAALVAPNLIVGALR